MQTLDEWLAAGAVANIEDSGSLVPAAATTQGGAPVLVLMPEWEEDTKRASLVGALLLLRVLGDGHLALCLDAYVRTRNLEDGPPQAPPSEDPGATDALVLVDYKDGWPAPRVRMCEYGRADDGTIRWGAWEEQQALGAWASEAMRAIGRLPRLPSLSESVPQLVKRYHLAGPFMPQGVQLQEVERWL